jgi:membrane protease YdiL (CAAX protease family)
VTAVAEAPGPAVRQRALRLAALVGGFAAAVALRIWVGGVGVAQSAPAGLTFAAALGALALADRLSFGPSRRGASRSGRRPSALRAGLAGAALICAPAALSHLWAGTLGSPTWAGFGPWLLVVTAVACMEEVLLRGRLFDAAQLLSGPGPAVVLCAFLFALLHVPLYGWQALPLDTAVGLVLGGLRVWSGTWAAPAVAHVAADVAGWVLR